jgi:sarcosine oxidase delta subunit
MEWMSRVLPGSVICASLLVGGTIFGAEFPPRATAQDAPRLLAATALVRGMDEEALVRFVPEQSGLNYVGCPNCNGGRQEGQLTWSPDQPDEVYCRYCKHRYLSQKYPATEAVTVHNPRGEMVRFPYWANDKGNRYFFQARRDDLVREYLAARTQDLAQLALVTKDKSRARCVKDSVLGR